MRDRRGFTLIEIMLVVIILGVLAAMVVPKLTGRSDDARRSVAKTDIESNLRKDPGDVTNWKGPYLKKEPLDPWGRAYVYRVPGDHNADGYDLFSMGKDGTEGNADDVVNWKEEE
jgi:general secretion pathway protein G